MTCSLSSPHLSNLTHLDLRKNNISPQGTRSLASAPYLTKLTTLDLNHNRINATTHKALATAPHQALGALPSRP